MVYIVTAVHNRFIITQHFVKMIKNQTIKNYKLVLVDDGSTDGTAEMVKNELPASIILRGDGSLWWGGALHMAYKWLKNNAEDEDIVLFSNDDVEWPVNYLEKAVEILADKKGVLLSGLGFGSETGKLMDSPIVWDFCENAGHRPMANEKVNCCSTRSLFFRVEDMKLTGGFHPKLLPHYLSDYEWTIRASRRGLSIISDSRLTYIMNESSTGFRDVKKQNLRQLFSKKSNANPLVRISFILLASPPKDWGKAILSQIDRIRK